MGNWQLEIAKMLLYVTFPVAMFHYFNQPEYFEEWVVKTKQELFPPENTTKKRQFEDALKEIKRQKNQSAFEEHE